MRNLVLWSTGALSFETLSEWAAHDILSLADDMIARSEAQAAASKKR